MPPIIKTWLEEVACVYARRKHSCNISREQVNIRLSYMGLSEYFENFTLKQLAFEKQYFHDFSEECTVARNAKTTAMSAGSKQSFHTQRRERGFQNFSSYSFCQYEFMSLIQYSLWQLQIISDCCLPHCHTDNASDFRLGSLVSVWQQKQKLFTRMYLII